MLRDDVEQRIEDIVKRLKIRKLARKGFSGYILKRFAEADRDVEYLLQYTKLLAKELLEKKAS